MNKKVVLLTIDPQNGFCLPGASLEVPGAMEDMDRLGKFINNIGPKLDDIIVTLDCHHQYDIGHPLFWRDSKGNVPVVDISQGKFPIVVTSEMFENGEYRPVNINLMNYVRDYISKLPVGYEIIIWPYHCLIGSAETNIIKPVNEAILGWERSNTAMALKVTKGTFYLSEHYSAYKAAVPSDDDPSTQPNSGMIELIQDVDDILLSGEALSHCLASTVRDIASEFSPAEVSKFVLLSDTTSNVPSFESLGDQFIKDMTSLGMRVTTTKEYN